MLLSSLIADHREIEASLDRLATSAGGEIDRAAFRASAELLVRHYAREREFLETLRESEPALAVKLAAQHSEALEIASHIEAALETGPAGDVPYLLRRFLAITQHNMIEEERDVFPWMRD